MSAAQFAAGSVAAPVANLFRAGFENTEITEVNLDLTSADFSKTAVLERISLSKSEVKPGETFTASAYVRTDTGQVFVQKIPVTVPLDTPTGSLLISIGDGNSLQRVSPTNQFVPKTLAELIKTINELKKTIGFIYRHLESLMAQLSGRRNCRIYRHPFWLLSIMTVPLADLNQQSLRH